MNGLAWVVIPVARPTPPPASLVDAVAARMWVPRYEEYVAVSSDAAE